MIHLYEKVCKTKDNKYGIVENNSNNPFLEGPCLITILAAPLSLKEVNGAMSQIAKLINPNIDTFYDKDKRIFGLGFGNYYSSDDRFSKIYPDDEWIDDFLNKYFYPLFLNNNNKIDPLLAMKNFRNITFLTYCGGTRLFLNLEKKIKSKMSDVGYSDTEIKLILSQICLAAISGNALYETNTSVLAVTFGDINDYYYGSNRKMLEGINSLGEGFLKYPSSIGFAINGNGDHKFKTHIIENKSLSSKITCFLNMSIENALTNREVLLAPITYEKIEKSFEEINKVKKR